MAAVLYFLPEALISTSDSTHVQVKLEVYNVSPFARALTAGQCQTYVRRIVQIFRCDLKDVAPIFFSPLHKEGFNSISPSNPSRTKAIDFL